MNGLVLTRDMLLAAIKASPVRDVRLAVRTWRKAAIKAQKAGFVDGAGQEHPPAPDHATRIKAADYLAKFHGAYPDKDGHQSLTGGGNLTIVWDVSAKEVPPVSARTALSSTASAGSNGSPAWSATADGERPPSA